MDRPKQVETILQVRVTHSKPLPFEVHQKLSNVACNRIHNWLYAQGMECGVKAELMAVKSKTD